MPTLPIINRRTLRNQRQRLSTLQRQLYAVRVAVATQTKIPSNHTAASYASIAPEVSTHYLHKLLIRKGITVLLPIIQTGNTLAFIPWNKGRQYKNAYGIQEPRFTRSRQRQLRSINTILVPLVGFDQQCQRIGMGGGYYDRLLAKQHSAKTFGLAFQQQQLRHIQPQPWDQALHGVITPRRQFTRLRQK